MAFKVIATAKPQHPGPGRGTLSREYIFASEPDAEALRLLKAEAQKEYKEVYSLSATVDFSVRRAQ